MPNKTLITAPAIPAEFKIETISELALTKKNLLATTSITTIADIESRDSVIAKSSLITTHLKAFEAERERIKAPFFKICSDIDRVAREHRTSLEDEKKRLDRLVGNFEAAEQKKRDDEARQAREESDKRQAEADRKAREAQEALKSKAVSPIEALAAELDAEDAQEQADAARETEEKRLIALAEEGRKKSATGGSMRTEYEVEVTDIKALYAAQPLCVKLTPDIVMIKGLHARGVELPGVKITSRPVYSARAK